MVPKVSGRAGLGCNFDKNCENAFSQFLLKSHPKPVLPKDFGPLNKSIKFRKKCVGTKQRDDLSTSQYKLDQNNLKTYNGARCNRRRQSSPVIRITTTVDQNSTCYSSSSTLLDNKNVEVRINEPSSTFSTSINTKLGTKRVS